MNTVPAPPINAPMHPGEVLHELYLAPLNMSAGALARALGVPRTRIERVIKGTTAITPDTALRLARYWNTSVKLWLDMQSAWDVARAEKAVRNEIAAIEPRAVETV